MQIEVANTPYTTQGKLPTHPQVLAYWIQYFAQRITTMVQDSEISNDTLRNWLNEIVSDLESLAEVDGGLDAAKKAHAQRFAEAMQAFIFHQGPDPEDDAQYTPDWTDIFPDKSVGN